MNKAKPFSISKVVVVEAYKKVKANKGTAGVDEQSITDFEKNLKDNLYKIWNRMSSGTYFPPAVRTVPIPKTNGGVRYLGIPTVGDRIAQMVVKMYLEPMVEPKFHRDSFGYRPNKSAKEAVSTARERCWKYDWVLDLDIKGFFDNLDHELVMRAVGKYTDCRWILLYIERWLKAPAQRSEGEVVPRDKGTPQGGVISPLLANVFLHLAFDEWMSKTQPQIPFERYADDIIVHCRTEEEAKALKESIEQRLARCKLQLHPEKTKIVYCKDDRRGKKYPITSFVFLGFEFRSRKAITHGKEYFSGYLPAVSGKAKAKIREDLRGWKLHRRTDLNLKEIAKIVNPKLQGWINYYGAFYRSALEPLYYMLDTALAKWTQRKYKRLRGKTVRAFEWLAQRRREHPLLFAHWRFSHVNG